MCCYQSQNYKIWKQFTTFEGYNVVVGMLLSITKLQNLKAIHNGTWVGTYDIIVVINHKSTKFESNSQLRRYILCMIIGCYQSQNYKIWKQFTTPKPFKLFYSQLLSIIKLQNLKAIHNSHWAMSMLPCVVINHKTTKFESNSQLVLLSAAISKGCYQSQNYKIWKQFTTL